MIEGIIKELKEKYDFITEDMVKSVKEEYKSSAMTEEELKDELQQKINSYIKKEKKHSKKNFIPLTDFFSYHLSEKEMHFHLIPTELLSYIREYCKIAGNKELGYEMYMAFFESKIIACLEASIPILEKNPNIERVSGTSTKMVRFHEDILKKLGFKTGINTDNNLALIFPDKTPKERENFRYYCYMSREEVLSRKHKIEEKKDKPKVRVRQSGYVNNVILLTVGITLLSLLFMYLAINLVSVK